MCHVGSGHTVILQATAWQSCAVQCNASQCQKFIWNADCFGECESAPAPCDACQPGNYKTSRSDIGNAEACQHCLIHTYQPAHGQTSWCFATPHAKTSRHNNTTQLHVSVKQDISQSPIPRHWMLVCRALWVISSPILGTTTANSVPLASSAIQQAAQRARNVLMLCKSWALWVLPPPLKMRRRPYKIARVIRDTTSTMQSVQPA